MAPLSEGFLNLRGLFGEKEGLPDAEDDLFEEKGLFLEEHILPVLNWRRPYNL